MDNKNSLPPETTEAISSEETTPSYYFRFISFMTLLTALAIDTVLPALPLMSAEFHISNANQIQFVITALFMGLMLGQLGFGPLSDAIGRKKTVYYGLGLFTIGTIISLFSNSLEMMLVGRFIQGIGAAGLRVMSMAITRDLYSGQEMARIMSFVMMILILVPVLAPTLGQAILQFGGWRTIFIFFLGVIITASLWIHNGLKETLHPEYRHSFSFDYFLRGAKRMFLHPLSGPHILCAGFIFGIMVLYISTTQQIFQDYYGVGDKFPLYFGASALSIGVGSYSNSILVKKYPLQRILHYALLGMVVLSLIGLTAFLINSSAITLPIFIGYLVLIFYFMGICFGNMNTIALMPMGDIAGVASAILGASSTALSIVVGGFIGQLYNHSLTPFMSTVFALSIVSFIIRYFSQKAFERSES